jgi:hypothetical protein
MVFKRAEVLYVNGGKADNVGGGGRRRAMVIYSRQKKNLHSSIPTTNGLGQDVSIEYLRSRASMYSSGTR